MTGEDVWMMDSIRQDADRDIVERMCDGDECVSVLDRWNMLRFKSDMTVTETMRIDVVSDDGKHPTVIANRCAAISLSFRLRGEVTRWRLRSR